jgi:CspA family cold shock protein
MSSKEELSVMADLQRGIVKWFNDAKGFGFIEHESGRDVFVHYSVIQAEGYKTLKDGEEVEYTLNEGDKGLNAASVLRVNAPESSAEEAEATAPNLQGGNVQAHFKPLAESVEVQSGAESSAAAQIIADEEISESVKQ